MKLLEVCECIDLFKNNITYEKKSANVILTEACGLILAKDIAASMNVPPFPKSAMDGYAVYSGDIIDASLDNPVKLNVIETIYAGDYKHPSYKKGSAIRVMTGGFIPDGYDCVIKQEDTDYGMDTVMIFSQAKPYMNYCRVGEDIKEGEVVLQKGIRLTPLHIGVLASLGIKSVEVIKPLSVSIISTGSEILDVGKSLEPGKIYNSIAYMLDAAIKKEGFESTITTCVDDTEKLRKCINDALQYADIVITTGGVSVGVKDLMPVVLNELNANVLFSRANIQPGTPTTGAVINGKPLICLSGNPYAALANFELYFYDIVSYMLNNESYKCVTKEAVLSSEYTKNNKMRRLVRAKYEDGKVYLPTDVHSSSVLYNLCECNCYIDMEKGKSYKHGDKVRVRLFKCL